MAYCVYGDVQKVFFNIDLSATTTVTSTQVTAWIDQHSVLIDSMLKYHYKTPLTGIESLLILKILCTYLAAAEVFSVMERSKEKNFKIDDIAYDKFLMEKGKDILDKIKKDSIMLSDTDLLSPASKTYMTENADTSTVIDEDESFEPVFRKNKQQW